MLERVSSRNLTDLCQRGNQRSTGEGRSARGTDGAGFELESSDSETEDEFDSGALGHFVDTDTDDYQVASEQTAKQSQGDPVKKDRNSTKDTPNSKDNFKYVLHSILVILVGSFILIYANNN